jgi:iron complex outermembrane receptor protein
MMKTSIQKIQRNTLATAIVIALNSGVVQAQKSEVEDSGIERIQVTSQKRTQSVQEVGIAISAFNSDDLKNKGIDDIGGITESMANVELQDITGGGMPVVVIRGVGLQDIRVNNTPTTPFYIDEVYQASVAQAAFTMFDIERVEILKGPQGGLYGRNATGGAIQVISAKPEFESTNGYVRAGYGSWNRLDLEGAFGTELSDKVAVRVSGKSVTSGDTYTHSVSENKDHGEADVWGGRVMLRVQPIDNLNILLKLHGGEDNSETDLLRASAVYNGGEMATPGLSVAALNGDTCDVPGAEICYTMDGRTHAEQGVSGSVHDTTSSTFPQLDSDWLGFSTRIDWSMGDYELTSITAIDEFNHGRNTDFDGHATEAQHIKYRSELESISQEIRLAYSGDNYNWIVGASWAEDTLSEDTLLLGGEGPLQLYGLTEAPQAYEQEAESKSVFGHLNYLVSDSLTIVTELRYTEEERSMDGGSLFSSTQDTSTFDAVSGKLGASYQLHDDAMVYANLSRGFKSGGHPGGIVFSEAALAPYDQETVNAVELGAKTEWLDNSLRVNGAIFFYDYQDQQGVAQIENPLGGVIKKLGNLGDTEIKGAELDISWLPAEGWFVQVGLGYTDAIIAESTATTRDTFGTVEGDLSVEGATLPNVASWSINTTISHEHTLYDDLLGVAQLTYALKDDMDLTMAITDKENAFYNEDGYGLANIRYTVMSEDEAWSLAAYINNVTDQEYRTAARPDGLFGFYEMFGAPRSFGVVFNYNFE